jgi:hypothetical protein
MFVIVVDLNQLVHTLLSTFFIRNFRENEATPLDSLCDYVQSVGKSPS